VGPARGDLDRALEWLRDPAVEAVDREPRAREEVPVEVLVTEQHYYVLLWKGAYDDARDYALRMANARTAVAGHAVPLRPDRPAARVAGRPASTITSARSTCSGDAFSTRWGARPR